MARTNATNFTGPLQFPYATAGTDIFKKEDVQTLAQAVDQHDHSTGKGAVLGGTSIPAGSITSAMIADGTIQATDIANGAITTTQIADGTIQSTDIAAAGIANDRLGPDVARANLLTNGGFEIWQRGNGPFTAGGYSADRWAQSIGGGSTLSVQKNTATVDVGSQASLQATYTHTATSFILQESKDGGQIQGRTVTLSMRVWCSAANAVRLFVQDSGVTYSSYHSGGSAWQTLTVTRAVAAGATSIQSSVSLEASCTAYLDNAMLVVGSQPADYAPLHPADDLARCLRYYETLGGNYAVGAMSSVTAGSFLIQYLAQKAVTPTITTTPASMQVQSAGQAQSPSSTTAAGTNQRNTAINVATPAFSAPVVGGSAALLVQSNVPGIAIEANP